MTCGGWTLDAAEVETMRQRFHEYRLTTAEILYHLPDYPSLLQTYLWQEFDLAPEYPALHRFLDFWAQNLDGKLHSVQVANQRLIGAPEVRFADGLFQLH